MQKHESVVFDLKTPKLYKYRDVRIEKMGVVSAGSVVSHLDVFDWCEMHGFKLLSFADRVPANSERTSLKALPKPKNELVGSKTIVGVAPPSIRHAPIVADVIKMIG